MHRASWLQLQVPWSRRRVDEGDNYYQTATGAHNIAEARHCKTRCTSAHNVRVLKNLQQEVPVGPFVVDRGSTCDEKVDGQPKPLNPCLSPRAIQSGG